MRTLLAAFLAALICCPLVHGEEEIAWGTETNGLVAHLRAVTPRVKPGQPIEFEIHVKNVSQKTVVLYGAFGKPHPSTWSFTFGEWKWSPPRESLMAVPLKPGATTSVHCLVAGKRDSLTNEQKHRFYALPFRNIENDVQESVRLPEGAYRVRAATWAYRGHDLKGFLETNTIEVQVIDR